MTTLKQAFYDNGRMDDCPILDFHAHMFPLGAGYTPKNAPEAMLTTMDRCGTALAVFASHTALYSQDINVRKDIAVVKNWPDRFRAYHAVIVRATRPDAVFRTMEENPDVFVGFKFHPDGHHVALDGPEYAPYLEYADAHRLICLCHTWGSPFNGPANVARVMERYPHLTLIAGHSFQGNVEEGARMAADYPNLYLELTSIGVYRGMLEMICRHVGSGRVLFGTDLPWFDTIHGVGGVLSAGLTDDDVRNILYRNGAALLGRFPWFGPLWEQHLKARGLTAATLP